MSARITKDYPRLRASEICSLCLQPKRVGLIVCWDCFERGGVADGTERAIENLDFAERALGFMEAQ